MGKSQKRYFRTCKKCGRNYRTPTKYSKVCDKCKIKNLRWIGYN